jgi:hypothetical protein
MRYTMRHETSWKSPAAREASPPGHPVAPKRSLDGRGGQRSRGLDQLRLPMARGLSQERCQRAGRRSCDRPPSQTLASAEKETHRSPHAWSCRFRLCDGSLDDRESCRSNRTGVSDRLSSQSYLARPRGIGLELPEAGTPSAGTRRGGHRGLEKGPLGGDKKKLWLAGPIWSFWMKAASSCFRMSFGHGLPEAGRPSSGIIIGEIGCR